MKSSEVCYADVGEFSLSVDGRGLWSGQHYSQQLQQHGTLPAPGTGHSLLDHRYTDERYQHNVGTLAVSFMCYNESASAVMFNYNLILGVTPY